MLATGGFNSDYEGPKYDGYLEWDKRHIYEDTDIKVLLGKIITQIDINNANDEIRFICQSGEVYLMYHDQDCCESVTIEDINGDLFDLLLSPITLAIESTADNPDACEVGVWTFYKFATKKGFVDIRWNGESNGYYSMSVDFKKISGS